MLLLAATMERECWQGTKRLLAELGELGYRASAKKAQLCQMAVVYLGYTLWDGKQWLTEARKKDCDSNTNTSYSKTGERILGHRWVLKTLDTWVCNTSCPPISPDQGKWGIQMDIRISESL